MLNRRRELLVLCRGGIDEPAVARRVGIEIHPIAYRFSQTGARQIADDKLGLLEFRHR